MSCEGGNTPGSLWCLSTGPLCGFPARGFTRSRDLIFLACDLGRRDVIKKFGKDVGINMDAVRLYGHQLLTALKQLKRLKVPATAPSPAPARTGH